MAKFRNKQTGKILTEEQLALWMIKHHGVHIIYCDLEGTAQVIDGLSKGDYYLIDECGNQCWIDTDKFEVIKERL